MVKFENVSVVYEAKGQKTRAVDHVSLEIRQGEIFGIVGLSGAGKSTLLRTINGLEKPTEGRVLVRGQDVDSLAPRELRNLRFKTGMIFQGFNLAASKTVYQNISFVLKAAGRRGDQIKERVEELLNLVGLSDKRDQYPSRLSGGQKQRVGIARALANDADLLLCDEATSALDPETTASILDLLKRLNRELGLTVILITHELDVVKQITNRVALMDRGRVEESGDTYEIFARPKSEFAVRFVESDRRFKIPGEVLENRKGTIVRLQYLDSGQAAEPLLFEAAGQCKVRPNILHGRIDYINHKPMGILYVELEGAQNAVDDTVKLLGSQGVDTEVIA